MTSPNIAHDNPNVSSVTRDRCLMCQCYKVSIMMVIPGQGSIIRSWVVWVWSQFSFPQSDLTRGCSWHTRANSPLMWARDKDNNLPVMIRINGLMSFFWISSPFTRGIYIMTSLDKIMVTTHQNSNNLPSASLISRPSHIYNKSLAHPALIKTYVWLIISETINLYKICKICVGTPCSNIDISLINQ